MGHEVAGGRDLVITRWDEVYWELQRELREIARGLA